jgi:predicted cupin superfamily sugar epimerase
MDPKAARLIHELDLRPHPEGGYYREVFRSCREVQPLDARPARSALTTIYFLLVEGQVNRWHRVASDEVWHFYEGVPVELFWIDAKEVVHRELLGRLEDGGRPVHTVPAGCWQAARPTGSYALVGCTVGPGFDFADFEMLDERSSEWERLRGLGVLPGDLG